MQFDIDSSTFNIIQVPTASHVASVSPTSSSSFESINFDKSSGVCFATMNLNKGELYILMRDNLWLYTLATNEYSMIHKISTHIQSPNATTSPLEQSYKDASEAFSRGEINYFVHSNDLLYVFKSDSTEYSIELQRPSKKNVLNYCKYLIRRQQYEEICDTNSISALSFLRNNLAETIDKNDINQVNDFHKLASLLFCNKFTINSPNSNNDDGKEQGESSSGHSKIRNQRSILFNKLTSLLPSKLCQPQQSLLNFINV